MTEVPTSPDSRTIERLEAATADRAVSASAPLGYDSEKNRVEMKNLVREVTRAVEEFAGERAAVKLRDRLDAETRRIVPMQRPASLCVFTDGESLDTLLLPEPFPACVIVDDRYYVRPLIQAAVSHGEFLLLSLAQGEVRLYRMNGEEMSRLELEGLPGSLTDVVGQEVEGDTLKHHVAGDVRYHGQGVAEGTRFHGHGAGEDDRIPELEQFLRAVDQALTDDERTRERPLLVAAVDELVSRFRNLSQHKHLLGETLTLSPDQTSEEDLRRAALEIFERWREQNNHVFRATLHEEDHGQLATDTQDIVRAAEEGRVDTLLASRERWLWGRFDPAAWSVELHSDRREDSRDLVDTAMRAAWRHGGHIRVVDTSEMSAPLEARLRY